jgi:hypothetical protein
VKVLLIILEKLRGLGAVRIKPPNPVFVIIAGATYMNLQAAGG